MRQFHCGVDMSKLTFDAVLRPAGTHIGIKLPHRKFSNTLAGQSDFLEWVKSRIGDGPNAIRVTMEATGVYHRQAAQTWHESGTVEVVVANPKRVRHFCKGMGLLHKTDAVDAAGIAYYSEHGRCHVWEPAPVEIRELSALLARLTLLDKDVHRESNRLEKATVSNASAEVRESITRTRALLRDEYKRIQEAIEEHYGKHPKLAEERALLRTIPSVGAQSSSYLLALLRSRRFESPREAAALAGLVPCQRQSGTSVHDEAHISREGSSAVRTALYMSAVSATRFNAPLAAIYQQLRANGKPPKEALTALARRLVHIGFGVLKYGQPFDPEKVTGKLAA